MMTVVSPIEFVITPKMTYVLFENNLPRRIYTDGRDFPPRTTSRAIVGYSIGKWLDTDGDGRYDTLEVETRNFKGPRTYEPSGIPLHAGQPDRHQGAHLSRQGQPGHPAQRDHRDRPRADAAVDGRQDTIAATARPTGTRTTAPRTTTTS